MPKFSRARGAAALVAVLVALPGVAQPALAGDSGPLVILEVYSKPVAVNALAQPYKLSLDARNAGSDARSVQLFLSRKFTNPFREESHQWTTDGGTTSVSCGSSLGTCSIDTNTDMGSVGSVSMDFTATAKATTHIERCAANGKKIYKSVRRKGTLTGSLTLKTNTTFFGTIANHGNNHKLPATLSATAEQTTLYFNPCPLDSTCRQGEDLYAPTLSDSSIDASRGLPKPGQGTLQFNVTTPSGAENLRLVHEAYAEAPGGFLSKPHSADGVALHSATVDFNPFAPLMKGTGTFLATSDLVTSNGSDCTELSRDGTFNGDIRVRFDGYGTFAWPNSDGAELRTFEKH